MFSKPIAIAASVASAQAALMAVTTTANDNGASLHKSDTIGCGLCLSLAPETAGGVSKWISGGTTSTWATEAAAGTISISTTTMTGDVCCAKSDAADSAGTTLCGSYADTTNNTIITLATNDFFQAALAQCPHNTTNCTAAGLLKDTSTAITFTDERYLNLDALGSYVTLKMIVLAAPGNAPSLLQK